jgi:hypothetical protein
MRRQLENDRENLTRVSLASEQGRVSLTSRDDRHLRPETRASASGRT